MNKYDYATKAVNDMFEMFMNLTQESIDRWNDEESGIDTIVRASLKLLQCKMETYYINVVSNISKDERDELEDMIQQFYGPVMAACGKDGE